MLKPNTQTGKPFVQMDLRTTKNFRMGERANLAIYWEFYNLFNRVWFRQPDNLISDVGTFGTSTATATQPDASTSARQIQFGLKLLF